MARRGFTLLEVMVAVAILGLGLTAILSAQFSAVSATAHAKNMSVATGLARCKMNEVEDQLRVEGFPEVDLEGEGPCCGDEETPNVSCSWQVTRPLFPEPQYGELDLEGDLEGSAVGALAGKGQNLEGTDDLSSLASGLAGGNMAGGNMAGGGDLASMAGAGIGGVTSMVMQMVYPELKTIFEASTRRIVVTLTWTEGDRSYDIELVQWVTQPQPGMDPSLLGAQGQQSGPGGGLTPGASGRGSPGRNPTGRGQSTGRSRRGGRR